MRKRLLIPLLCLAIVACSHAQQYNVMEAFPGLNFSNPVGLYHDGTGNNRLYVVEQPGKIQWFQNSPSATTPSLFLDITDRITSGGELGLLGLAFDPNYATNGYIYVDYTADGPLRTVISRFKRSAQDTLMIDTGSEQVLLTIPQPYENHNGGQIAFGPDGYLYIGMGDGGSANDPQNRGQNLQVLLGKILRIDVHPEGTATYGIPADNPFAHNSDGNRDEIYAFGLRNPWRFSFDRTTGRLWCGDVGQGKWEEVDIIEKGKNYGWRLMEGKHCFNPSTNCDTTGLTLPVWEYGHDNSGGISITGGFVYRGTQLEGLVGKYIYADFGSGRVWALSYTGGEPTTNELIKDTDLGIASFGVDGNNELYICAFNGKIYKIAAVSGVEDQKKEKSGFQLRQNRPNPASALTTISYSLGKSAQVLLSVYDVMGRNVANLVDDAQSSGEHQAELDTRSLSAGTYYYRLSADGIVETMRMMVTK